MSVINNILATKGHWLPVGRNGFHPKRWLLLEGNRYGVIVALLLLVFVTNLTAGTIWTFELQQLLTETSAVQTLLNTFLSGIILVSIVVSTSSIVLSYDITSLDNQENRMEAAMEFRRNIDELSDKNTNPTDPSSFVKSMTQVIRARVEDLDDATESSDKEFAETLQEYTEGVVETLDSVDKSVGKSERGEFSALWDGLEVGYGSHLNRSDRIKMSHETEMSDEYGQKFDELVKAFELFATGRSTSRRCTTVGRYPSSQVLLVISLPTILVVASSTLAIEANLLPDFWLFGLPPLLTFVSFVITVALAPFVTLIAYMLRIATVAKRTASAGPFTIS